MHRMGLFYVMIRPTYWPSLDGLRAVAIVAVLIFHLHSSWLPSGFVGVDIFFVLSGFVIAASLLRQQPTTFRSGYRHFIQRRLWRLLPALVVCLVSISALSLWLLPDSELSALNRLTALSALFGLSNFVLAHYDTDSLNPFIEYTLFTPTWSLGVEWQFYVLLPILLYSPKWRVKLVVALGIASVLASAYLSYYAPSAAYYLLPSRLWQLLLGTGVFLLWQRQRQPVKPLHTQRLAAVGAILLLVGIGFSPVYPFPMPGGLAATLGSAALIFSLVQANPTHGWLGVLSHPKLVQLGQGSYSLYLWHWPIFCFFRWNGGLNTAAEQLSAVCLSLLLAYVSYHYVEQRWRFKAA